MTGEKDYKDYKVSFYYWDEGGIYSYKNRTNASYFIMTGEYE